MNSYEDANKIINKAFELHSKGNILEAAKYYQSFINKGFKDQRVFSKKSELFILSLASKI